MIILNESFSEIGEKCIMAINVFSLYEFFSYQSSLISLNVIMQVHFNLVDHLQPTTLTHLGNLTIS